jgi:hypothetical protein
MGDDVPYWYSGRTNTGILAAAALRLKDTKIALEEYAVRRGGVKGNGAGRADLYLYDSRANRSYDFEFKFRYAAIGWSSVKRIKSALKDAKYDVSTLPKPTYPCYGVALTFLAPYTKNVPDRKKWAECWRKFLDSILDPSDFGADFVAIHRASDKAVQGSLGPEDLGFHPGVAAIGKIVRRHG